MVARHHENTRTSSQPALPGLYRGHVTASMKLSANGIVSLAGRD